MAHYSMNPADYLTPDQLEYLKDHTVMTDDQLRQLQEQILFLREYNISTDGGKNLGNCKVSEKWYKKPDAGREDTMAAQQAGDAAPTSFAPKRKTQKRKSSGGRKEPKLLKRKLNKGPSSRKEAFISEFEVTTDDENPGEQARGTPLGNSLKQLRKRRYQMRYEDNSGQRSGGDNCTDGSEDEPVSHWKQSGRNLSGNLRLSRAEKKITSKQTVLKKLKKVTYTWDADPCGVCGVATWQEGNEMIICDGHNCGVVVHIGCYGLSAVPEDEFWFCDGCQDKLNPLESNCILCPVTGGVLREVSSLKNCRLPTNQGKKAYAHICCALFCGGAAFDDQARLMGINLSGLKQGNVDLQCTVCHQTGNGCTQCSFPRCFSAYHVLCARSKGFTTAMKYEGGTLSFCLKHSIENELAKPENFAIANCIQEYSRLLMMNVSLPYKGSHKK